MSDPSLVSNSTSTEVTDQKNIQVGFAEVLLIFTFVLIQNAIVEAVLYYQVTSKEEYKDLITKVKNLAARLKLLKHEYIYGTSNKKKQEGKMIKV